MGSMATMTLLHGARDYHDLYTNNIPALYDKHIMEEYQDFSTTRQVQNM